MRGQFDAFTPLITFVLWFLFCRYYAAVTDVLTSVKKTEESLRRLKNLREKTSNSNPNAASSSNSGGMSDDDKIRLQLHVDISTWTNEIEKMHVHRSDVDKLNELNELVQNCSRIKIDS